MEHPLCLLLQGAGTAGAEDRLPMVDDLGLNKKIAEGRMQCIRSRRCKNYFRVTRDIDLSARPGAIDDSNSAQFNIIFGRNGDLGMGDKGVGPAAKLPLRLRENT